MSVPTAKPENERKRLEELLSYKILDTAPEPAFDEIAALAAKLCEAPMAFVTFVDKDREWFKATFGVPTEFRQLPRDGGFCATAILAAHQPLIVEDATADHRFADNPVVGGETHLRFYAGIPIVSRAGFALGTLSVVDVEPRDLKAEQLGTLKVLASVVADQLELRRATLDIATATEKRDHLRGSVRAEPNLASQTSLRATLANASQISDRLGRGFRVASAAAAAGDVKALDSFAARVTRTLQDLLLMLSHLDRGESRAASVAAALESIVPHEETH